MRKLLVVLGVPIDALNMAQALDRLEEFIAIGRATGKTHQVATVNVDFVVNALRDPELRRILQEADLATADGMPVVWASRLLGVPLEGRVTGVDLVPALAERAASKGYKLFLLGAAPSIAQAAARLLLERYPGLQIVGVVSPEKRPVLEMDPSILEQLKAARPDILLVAFGNPKQERWISMYARELEVPVCIGIGGTLDMLAGDKKRAPLWMQQFGLEWVFRLLQEPRRLWKRYVLDAVYFGYYFLRQWWEMRKAPSSPMAPMAHLEHDDAISTIRVHGRLDAQNYAEIMTQATLALAESPWLVVDLAEATFLDSAALGALVGLAKQAREAGGALLLAAVPPQIRQLLKLVHLDQFFELYPDVLSAQESCRERPQPFGEPDREYTGWSVVKMPPQIDSATVPILMNACETKLEQNARMILDFSETMFLSSAGMAAIVKLNRQSRERSGEVRIAGCSREVLQTIQLVRLDKIVPLYSDLHDAVSTPNAGLVQIGG